MMQVTLREYLRTTEDAISSGRIDEAMANCQNVLTYFPEALEAQRLLGEVYLAQGQLEEAQQTFEWILTNDPENVIVYCDRALISERVSDTDTALDCYQQAYELSRGNTNIRQEFNQLSTRSGQQEFMFSRAGLARLYMRGDLLTQAIQEWDAVLAISPDRLDARLGLMETHWRDANYARVEQIATQLLDEIPTCLKALLYLAHVTSISNIQHTREFLRRAEALDPELLMAQEIFADLAASQPNDPFLQLIAKEPILLEDGVPVNIQIAQAPDPVVHQNGSGAVEDLSFAPYSSRDSLSDWDKQLFVSQVVEPSSNVQPQAKQSGNLAALDPFSQRTGDDLASWQTRLDQPTFPVQEEQPWYQSIPASVDPLQNWESLGDESDATQGEWEKETQHEEEELATPPAWLDTLTKNNLYPQNETTQQISAEPEVPRPAPAPVPEIQPQAARQDADMPFSLPALEEEDESDNNWPDWLKSLGAESLEPDQPISAELPVSVAPIPPTPTPIPDEITQSWEVPSLAAQSQPLVEEDPWLAQSALSASDDSWAAPDSQPDWAPQPVSQADLSEPISAPDWQSDTNDTPDWQSDTPDWMQQLAGFQTPSAAPAAVPDWMQQLAGVDSVPYQEPAVSVPTNREPSVAEQEQQYMASLENLEKDLQSQGFVPLAPGALAAFAQTNEPAAEQPQRQENAALSSALAQLGNLSQPPAVVASEVPWWNTASAQQAVERSTRPAARIPEPTEQFTVRETETSLAKELTHPLSPLPATPIPMPPTHIFEPSNAGGESFRGSPLVSAYRADALLDSDLETTMKRPAINLQPFKQTADQSEPAYGNGKGRNERRHSDHSNDNNLSNHEHLVKGYHYQLEGDYDDAMQEYRLIIRNAPELLDDVISNTRALLKFNPNFSLGYRVLGDAYMRKGEYLQAMESYNKALTMAKKARS
jgi:tetratricopeptide (TPR) repeat protein